MDDDKKPMKKKMKIVMASGEGQEHVEKMVIGGEPGKLDQELEIELASRGNVVMTRLTDEDLNMIDAFVNLEVFSSRSEAVAYFTHAGLEQKKEMTARVMPYVEQIKKLKAEAKSALK
jgi:Arc/MetJ-type ribon-helix-helix transcriptional regulator